MANVPKAEFERQVESDNPPTISRPRPLRFRWDTGAAGRVATSPKSLLNSERASVDRQILT